MAAHFAASSSNSEAALRSILKGTTTASKLMDTIDPSWLRTVYTTTVEIGDQLSVAQLRDFQVAFSNLLHGLGVHQRAIARLGTQLIGWDGRSVDYSALGNSLDAICSVVDNDTIRLAFVDHRASAKQLHALADALFGLTIVIAALESTAAELNGYRSAIAAAGVAIVIDASEFLRPDNTCHAL